MNKFVLLCACFLLSGVVVCSQKRVVSLAPSLTSSLYQLEAGSLLVGCTSYCLDAVHDQIPVVASAIDVNIEKVILARPDLVVATTITKPEIIEKLKSLGLKVVVFPKVTSFESICSQFLELGRLVGKTREGENAIARYKTQVDEILSSVRYPKGQQKMIIQIGANPLFVVTPRSFMDDYISLSGCVNVMKEGMNGAVSRESVLIRNPDVIFIVTMGMVGDEEKRVWEGFQEMKAASLRKIFIIDSNKACLPTPKTFVETLREIVTLLNQRIHP